MKYKSYKRDIFKDLEKAKKEAYELIGEQGRSGIVEEITRLGLIDTGTMKNSADYDNQGDKVVIGVGVDYSVPLDQGSSFRRATPFVKPGIYGKINIFKKIVEVTLRRYLR